MLSQQHHHPQHKDTDHYAYSHWRQDHIEVVDDVRDCPVRDVAMPAVGLVLVESSVAQREGVVLLVAVVRGMVTAVTMLQAAEDSVRHD